MALGPDGRPACHRHGDGEPHDEAFLCFACERPVCGYCAEVVGTEWLCPACAARDKAEGAHLGPPCPTCERGEELDVWKPIGLTCGCGHHFHIGVTLLTAEIVPCPRCEVALPLGEIVAKAKEARGD